MDLIIGGAFQGKLAYALETYGLTESDVCDLAVCDPAPGYRCYRHLEALSRREPDAERYLPLFENAVVIMTSNAGAENIIAPKQLGFMSQDDEKVRYQRMKTGVMDEVKRMFKPEFLNRIDDTIVFHPLTKDHMKEIVTILLNVLAKRTKNQMSIRLNAGDDVKEYLVEKGYDEKYGARPLKRTIQNLIEDKLAELVLEGKVREGDSVKITCKDGELKFSARHPQTAGKTSASVVKS